MEEMTSRLTITFEVGSDDNGEPVFRSKSFSNLQETATNEQLLAFAQYLIPLQSHPVFSVTRNNSIILA